jgi:hypothetical protein
VTSRPHTIQLDEVVLANTANDAAGVSVHKLVAEPT